MDKKTFKSQPYHLKKKHSGEIEKTIHSSDTEIGTKTSPADLHVYGTATFEDIDIAVNSTMFGHRLSVSGSSPVPLANVPSSSFLYLTPYNSEFIGLYVDGHWNVKQTSMVTKSLDVLSASNLNYDVFVYWDTSREVVDLDFWPWSGQRTRENGLVRQDGVLVRHNDPTRRYAGTVRTVANGVIADTTTRRFVWNFYNRVDRHLQGPTESTDSWSYSGTSFRPANNQTANSFEFVIGDAQMVQATVYTLATAASPNWGCTVGIGVNSTSDNSANVFGTLTLASMYVPCISHYVNIPTTGYNRFYWLEISGGISITWTGDLGFPTYNNSGIFGKLRG